MKFIMIKKILLLLALALIITTSVIYSHAKNELTAEEYWDKYNKNTSFNSMEYKAKITIKDSKDEIKQKIFKAYLDKQDKALFEVISSASDYKIRVLKLGAETWIYMPNLKKSILIQGNVMKKPFLGSDLSYEDIIINKNFYEFYDVKFIREDVVKKSIPVVILELTAKDDSLIYYKKIIKIDKVRYFPWETKCYSKDGKFLKKIKTLANEVIGNKKVVTKFMVRDMVRNESVTYVELFSVRHNIEINDSYFTKEYLENR
jgi:outer membrane lipoprotein-sorting protein